MMTTIAKAKTKIGKFLPTISAHALCTTRRFRRKPAHRVAAATLSIVAGFVTTLDTVAAKEFAPIGGGGDFSFRDLCPAGQYLVGLRVRSGLWVDQMSITCAPVKSEGSTGAQYHGPARGGNGGGPSEKDCGANAIVDGVGLQMTDRNRQVREFVLYCRSTTGGARHSLSLGNGAGTFPSINQTCPNGEAAIGIQGRGGKDVNAVGLICGSSPNVVANTPSPPPSQSTGTSLGEKIAAYAESQLDKCVDAQGRVRSSACPTLPPGQVGDGECTHFVQAALKAAGANPPVFNPRPYDWGREISLAEAQRGDIVQLEAAHFAQPGGGGNWGTGTGPEDKHSAIIAARNGSTITLIEQNTNNLRAVKRHTYDFSWPHTGRVIVYRAESNSRLPSRRWQERYRPGYYGQRASGG
jgi:hypothetical protein